MLPALIIFVKKPVPGTVKTRLAKDLGELYAAEVYRKLLEYTKKISLELDAARFVFYADDVPENDIWTGDAFAKKRQKGSDLGTRMINAFDYVFGLGHEKAVIIGSDCPELRSVFVQQTFFALGTFDAVLGPAVDGGYYLLGLTRIAAMKPADDTQNVASVLFTNKEWSAASVAGDTMMDFERLELNWFTLPELRDIDDFDDYQYFSEHLNRM